MAMVVRANRIDDGIGGHISTYASAATLYEIGFQHFFRAGDKLWEGDMIYFQGHASPGIYARAFLEGTVSIEQMRNFRRELGGDGLSSYPHPWLMPGFWQFPTVSMGLSPIMAIYQARFNRYLEDRGLKPRTDAKVWAFIGDGETDEPETLGAITLASREKLDNLIFVINCNLQRLDGPVRGNGKIIQELERIFRGAGWNVIKVLWGGSWDPILAQDKDGFLVERMEAALDGDYQRYTISPGKYIREHFFGTRPEIREMVKKHSDEQLERLARGGHDSEKVYAAYKAAVENTGSPTVILAKTIKGYGLGEAGEGKNINHQQKKLNEEELKRFRSRFRIPLTDEEVRKAPFYRPAPDSPEMEYLREKREALGGSIPKRTVRAEPLREIPEKVFEEFKKASGPQRKVATTMVIVHMLSRLMRDPDIGELIVPIVPDEARTFGMESLFRQVGIYSSVGQLYEPVDADTLLYYKEEKGRADPGRRHNRGGQHVFLYRGRHGLLNPRHKHHPFFHLLLNVRVPAHRGSYMGRGRHEMQRVYGGRDRGADHACGRRSSAPGRKQPSFRLRLSKPEGLRPGFFLRDSRDSARRNKEDVSGRGGHILLHNRNE